METIRETGELIKSDYACLKTGVPQGSVIGPLLYIIYTNELPDILDETMVQFADDISLILGDHDLNNLGNRIANTLHTLEEWFLTNELKLNKNKTHLMKFDFRKKKTPTNNKGGDTINDIQ